MRRLRKNHSQRSERPGWRHRVSVDHELQMVSLQADPAMRAAIVEKLQDMGYPEKGSVEGFEAGVSNIKSYVSCAIGKMS